ncbi:S-layer homology domain-containing protein [Cohnella hongkongensis]|uniref:S-layer homology domain-containing protein n=1 Tax=Cohnella hongkongensis TaxID=178337 RepID=A0ABV9F8S0_9BACL
MGAFLKRLVAAVLLFLILAAGWPAGSANAAKVQRFDIRTDKDYLIAGLPYATSVVTDKAGTTLMFATYDYSVNNGATWSMLDVATAGGTTSFRLPLDPQLTRAVFRIGAEFHPILGSKTYSEKTIGPYSILQPLGPTNVTAKANPDGTVLLSWDDNSNMETRYLITRNGPDGTQVFAVGNTTEYVGPIAYTDKNTNKNKDTIYVYTISADIDEKYPLPDNLLPGIVYVAVKTKAPIHPIKAITEILDTDLDKFLKAPVQPVDDKRSIFDKRPELVIPQSVWEEFNNGSKTLPAIAVNSVELNVKSATLQPGATFALVAKVLPSDATNRKVVWSSDDERVARVTADGQVAALAPGTAKITAKTEEGGFAASAIVTVSEPQAEEQGPAEPEIKLSDIEDHPAKPEIMEAVALGFVAGYPNGMFLPDANVTRAEFAKMLMTGLNQTGDGGELPFRDEKEVGNWARPMVAEAVKLGVIQGYADGTFRPNANITHAEMMAMVVRASGFSVDETPGRTGFADDASIPAWAKPSVSKAQETGIIIVGGLSARFEPQALSTRAEAASAIVKMLHARKTQP